MLNRTIHKHSYCLSIVWAAGLLKASWSKSNICWATNSNVILHQGLSWNILNHLMSSSKETVQISTSLCSLQSCQSLSLKSLLFQKSSLSLLFQESSLSLLFQKSCLSLLFQKSSLSLSLKSLLLSKLSLSSSFCSSSSCCSLSPLLSSSSLSSSFCSFLSRNGIIDSTDHSWSKNTHNLLYKTGFINLGCLGGQKSYFCTSLGLKSSSYSRSDGRSDGDHNLLNQTINLSFCHCILLLQL